MRRSPVDARALEAEIARLPDLGLDELRRRWMALFGRPAPKFFRRKFLVRGIAYRMQVAAYGGLSKATLRRLAQFAEAKQAADAGRAVSNVLRIKPGTKLIRVWNDKTHTVTALPDGEFEWQGSRYRSLSKIARAITGTQWNGLVFFGVKPQPSTNKNASKNKGRARRLPRPHAHQSEARHG
jgi:hypothetical protein